MIGARTLHQIHCRLQDIKKLEYANSRFGNVTAIIAVGDLYQLPPVKDKKVFGAPGSWKCYMGLFGKRVLSSTN